MDFSTPATIGGLRDTKDNEWESESDDEEFKIPNSHGVSLRSTPPPKTVSPPESKMNAETEHGGAASNTVPKVESTGMEMEMDVQKTGPGTNTVKKQGTHGERGRLHAVSKNPTTMSPADQVRHALPISKSVN
jgi:hypothetical protein